MRLVLVAAAKFFCRNSNAASAWTCWHFLQVVGSTKNIRSLRKNISAFSDDEADPPGRRIAVDQREEIVLEEFVNVGTTEGRGPKQG